MAIPMYKSVMGWVEYKPGDEKHSATHKLLTNEEYSEMVKEKPELKKRLEDCEWEKDRLQEKLESCEYQADTNMEAVQKEAAAAIEKAEAERDAQWDLNNNLVRMMKERANAKRDLQPKKKHSGYLFSGKIMQAKVISEYDSSHRKPIYADVWTATLETPYDGTFPLYQVRDRIFDDLMGDEGVLAKLDVYCAVSEDDDFVIWKGSYSEAIKASEGQNFLFDYKFMVNSKSGLWEIQITTTRQMTVLPEMLPNVGNSKPQGKNFADKE